MPKKLIGFALILASALLLMVQTKSVPLESFITWPFLVFFIGAIVILFGFINQNDKLVLIGGIAAGVGLFIWGQENIDDWSNHWSILMIFVGIAVLLQFLINKHNLSAIIAAVLILSGIFAWPGLREIASLAAIAPTLNTYWPVVVLGLGVYFLVRK